MFYFYPLLLFFRTNFSMSYIIFYSFAKVENLITLQNTELTVKQVLHVVLGDFKSSWTSVDFYLTGPKKKVIGSCTLF